MEIDKKKLTILFIPEAGVYPYLRSLAVLGDANNKNNKSACLTHCTGQMIRCPMMAMNRLSTKASVKEKKSLCDICQKSFKSAQKKYDFPTITLKDFLDDTIIQFIGNLSDLSQDKLENLIYKNIEVGKIAKYDFSLETKNQVYSNLSEDHRAIYIDYIKNTILAIILSEKICSEYNPALFLTFNQYAQCQGVRAVADAHKVKFLSITNAGHKNADYSRLIPYKKLNIGFTHCLKWNSIKNIPILSRYVSECWDDTMFHFYGFGSHIFSRSKHGDPKYIFEKLSLDYNKKTIVVYTSSNDERGGYEELLKVWGDDINLTDAFPTQIAWLSWLREYVAKRDDVQIVVRIHPREGNRKFGFGSSHLQQLNEAFKENTESFFVIWPDDPISSYDLMELADLCLIAWTTVGQESARVGIPVLSYTGNMHYPDDDFIQVATTEEEYKKRLDLMINIEFTWKHLVKAIRFYHWRTFIPALNLEKTVPSDFEDKNFWPEAPVEMGDVINDILFGKQDLVEYNLKKWQESLSNDAILEETEAIKKGIRYLLDRVFYPPVAPKLFYILNRVKRIIINKFSKKRKEITQKKFKDYSLKFSTDVSKIDYFINETKYNSKLRVLIGDGSAAILVYKGKIKHRLSPVIIRLARLHAFN